MTKFKGENIVNMLVNIIIIVIGIGFFYFLLTWKWQCKQNRMMKNRDNLDIINLGSTYAYYDLDYDNLDINGCNLANIPQYLDYDFILLKKYIKYVKHGGKVLIVLPNFVFVGGETNTDKKVYYEALAPWEIKKFSLGLCLKYVWKAAKEPFTRTYRKEAMKWEGHIASYSEKKEHAERRIEDWTKNLKIPNVQTDEITEELMLRIEKNKKLIFDIIELCKKYGKEPILIVPPVSEIMREKVSKDCLKRYLKQPINEIQSTWGVRVFDYTEEKEFWNVNLYLNSDCMNQEGREKFTLRVLQDIGVFRKHS